MTFKVLHKWVALLVFIQLIIWLGTGFLLGKVDMSKAAGRLTLVRETPIATPTIDELASITYLIDTYPNTSRVILTQRNGKPVYLLEQAREFHANEKSEYVLVDAYNGHEFHMERELAIDIALASYANQVEVKQVQRLVPPIEDLAKELNPVWRIEMQDEDLTSVYIRENTGQVITHVNSETRWRDLLMMLHFMDYAQQGSFNNIFMKVFGLLMLLLTGTGMWWGIRLLIEKQVHLTWFSNQQRLIVKNAIGQVIATVNVSSNTSLLYGLADNDIILPSTCAGGGVCGRCRFKSWQNLKVLPADKEHISKIDIQNGYRLACQHRPEELQEIIIDKSGSDQEFQLELISSEFLTPFIKQLIFKATDNRDISYSAGAHVQFLIPEAVTKASADDLPPRYASFWPNIQQGEFNHAASVRHYSLATYCDNSNQLVFNLKMQFPVIPEHDPGIGSFYLSNLAIGSMVNVKGPYQDFAVPTGTQNKELVFIGAGSGLAPLKAMLEEQLYVHVNSNITITLFYGVRDVVDLIHHAWLTNLENEFPQFSYKPVVSQPTQSWLGAIGYVQPFLDEYLDSHKSKTNCLFFLCGPKEMMRQTSRILKYHGIPQDSIFIERFQTIPVEPITKHQ